MIIPLKCFCLFVAYAAIVQGRSENHEDESSARYLRGHNEHERHLAPVNKEGNSNIEKTYIVVFKDDFVNTQANDNVKLNMVGKVGGKMKRKFKTVLNGMTVTLSPTAAMQLAKHERVKYLTEDSPVYAYELWGLDRIDQGSLPTDNTYMWKGDVNSGAGVNVCVSDGTGRIGC